MSNLWLPDRRIVRPDPIVPGRESMNMHGFGHLRRPHRSPMLLNPYRLAVGGGGGSNLQVALGGFNAPASSTTGANVTVSGLAFQPKIVFFWMVGRTGTDDTAALSALAAKASFGFSDGTSHYAWGAAHSHGGSNSNNGFVHQTGMCVIRSGVQFNDGTWRGMDCAMTSDGFTLSITATGNPFAWTAIRIQYLALAGSDLSVKIGSFTATVGTGNQSYTPTGLTFQPVALIMPNAPYTGSSFQTIPSYSVGVATGSSNMWAWGAQSSQNVATADTNRYLRSDECHVLVDSSGVGTGGRLRHVSMDATGFTMNRVEIAGSNIGVNFAALGGIAAKAGTFTAASGGGSITGLGFTPKAILFMTHATTQSTADTTQADMSYAIGCAITGPTQKCQLLRDADNSGTNKVITGQRDDSVIMTSDTTPALDSRIAISSLDSDGFTYTMPTSTLNGYLVGYLALG